MKNQFFYTRRVEKPVQIEGQEKQYDELRDSFNVNKIIRSITMDGTVIVILDDFNERVTEKPEFDHKKNKIVRYNKLRETVQSEIHLNTKDGERFYKLTNIE